MSRGNSIAWITVAGALWLAAVGPLAGSPVSIAGETTHAASPSIVREARDADAVRAAFVYNFAARHVKWPDGAHTDKTSPFEIGVLGDVPMHNSLTETCRERKSGERRINVRMLTAPEGAAKCHIVYVPKNRESEVPAIVAACGTRPVLIVCETDTQVGKGAQIGFYVEKSKVRLAADPTAAKRAGLEISSELLKLARIVDPKAGAAR